ncbi:hypothetical protein GCM10010329_77250 [Streptomyces spiroverticillatus]|uniref:Uncharacterized protein n=1 Tax=Streptomyces finlayi TaxID=67296 RepID=A0A919CE35_9ACTN|nr:hypothetical protein [Streptomyces finlayi]GHA42901.1 hypothetical protein GCM10010329_77250 [Streptomyces spiroverticillatus]GHD13901.1 hypothetical protein GCM10010334_72660 [Streptomyces finlayi]
MTKVALRPYALLPRQYDERKVLASTIDARGRALWLICPDARFPHRWAGRDVPAPLKLPFNAVVVVSDRGEIREQPLHGVAVDPVAFDALSGGGFVLSGGGGPHARSGQIFGPDGRSRRRFPIGTRLTLLLADRRAGFWTGYAGEGIYGGDRVSTGALVRWDARGNPAWFLHPPEPHHLVAEVSTVNVSDSAVHAMYWPGAPLASTDPTGVLRVRDLPVSTPRGLAIRDDRLLLLAGNERGRTTRADTVHHLHLTADEAVITDRESLIFPNGDPVRRYARRICRGPDIFLQTPRTCRQWWALTLPPLANRSR